MAQRLIYDGNWPQTGGNSGATAVNDDNGNTQPPHDLNGGNDQAENKRRDDEIGGGNGGGGNGNYGQVRLYWWQGVGVLNDEVVHVI